MTFLGIAGTCLGGPSDRFSGDRVLLRFVGLFVGRRLSCWGRCEEMGRKWEGPACGAIRGGDSADDGKIGSASSQDGVVDD